MPCKFLHFLEQLLFEHVVGFPAWYLDKQSVLPRCLRPGSHRTTPRYRADSNPRTGSLTSQYIE